MRIINKYWLPLLLVFSYACSTPENKQNENFYDLGEIHVEVFLDAETDAFIGSPGQIISGNDVVYFSDNAFKQIIGVNMDGENVFSFGKQGRGPGEFISPSRFWVFDEGFMVYDYNSFKFINYNLEAEATGDRIIERNPANPDGFPPNIPMTVEAVSSEKLVIPTNGRNGSLFAIANTQSDDLIFAGKAIGEHVESYNPEEVQMEFNKGAIPPIFQNLVLLSTRSSAIYSFQQTTGLLEKFNYSGDFIWGILVQPDVQKRLFEEIAKANENLDAETCCHQLFNYAWSLDANEEGVAILLNVPEGESVTVAWIPEDGSKIKLATFPLLNQGKHNMPGSFTISPDNKWVYFLNSIDGVVTRAEWLF